MTFAILCARSMIGVSSVLGDALERGANAAFNPSSVLFGFAICSTPSSSVSVSIAPRVHVKKVELKLRPDASKQVN